MFPITPRGHKKETDISLKTIFPVVGPISHVIAALASKLDEDEEQLVFVRADEGVEKVNS